MKRRTCKWDKLSAAAIAAAIVVTYATTACAGNRPVSISIAFGTNSDSAQIIDTNDDCRVERSENLVHSGNSQFLNLSASCAVSSSWSTAHLRSAWNLFSNTGYYMRIQCDSIITNILVVRGLKGSGSIYYSRIATCMILSGAAPIYSHSLIHEGATTSSDIVFGEPFAVVQKSTLSYEYSGTNDMINCAAEITVHFHVDTVLNRWGENVLNDVEITSIDSGLYPETPDIKVHPTNNELNFSWYSLTNETYDLLTCSNLAQGSWTSHTTNIAPSPPVNTISIAPGDASQFYMLRTSQP